jgi:hypothetical protein
MNRIGRAHRGYNLPPVCATGDGVIERGPTLLQRMSPEVARNGPPAMSAQRSLTGGKRTSRLRPPKSENDPGCVKTLCCCYDSPVILWGN